MNASLRTSNASIKRPLSAETSPTHSQEFPELQPPKPIAKIKNNPKKTKTETKPVVPTAKQILGSVKELIQQQTKTIKNSLTLPQITQLIEAYKPQATSK